LQTWKKGAFLREVLEKGEPSTQHLTIPKEWKRGVAHERFIFLIQRFGLCLGRLFRCGGLLLDHDHQFLERQR
jgi:hypothetical protein